MNCESIWLVAPTLQTSWRHRAQRLGGVPNMKQIGMNPFLFFCADLLPCHFSQLQFPAANLLTFRIKSADSSDRFNELHELRFHVCADTSLQTEGTETSLWNSGDGICTVASLRFEMIPGFIFSSVPVSQMVQVILSSAARSVHNM